MAGEYDDAIRSYVIATGVGRLGSAVAYLPKIRARNTNYCECMRQRDQTRNVSADLDPVRISDLRLPAMRPHHPNPDEVRQ